MDPQTKTVCPSGEIGEFWLSGPTVAKSYWGRENQNNLSFRNTLSDRSGEYLRTGDLGGLIDGELYVCGRSKDLIIIRGKNIYPQDIEAIARAADPVVANGAVAAVVISLAGQQRLLLAMEVNRTARHTLDADALISCLRRAVLQEHDIMLDRVALVRPGAIPKTSSGKIQRRAVAVAFESGTLSQLGVLVSEACELLLTDETMTNVGE